MKKPFFLIISLYLGVYLTGAILGIFHFKVIGFIHLIFGYIPTPKFLSDVAAFEAIVIAIAIPLSFEMVSRTSERYDSDIIILKFINKWEIKFLPMIIIILVIITILTRFLVKDVPDSLLWRVFAWISLLGFISVATILLQFITTLKKYLTNIKEVLDELYKEVEKSLE